MLELCVHIPFANWTHHNVANSNVFHRNIYDDFIHFKVKIWVNLSSMIYKIENYHPKSTFYMYTIVHINWNLWRSYVVSRMLHHKTHKGAIEVDKGFTCISKPLEVPLLVNKMMTPNSTLLLTSKATPIFISQSEPWQLVYLKPTWLLIAQMSHNGTKEVEPKTANFKKFLIL